MKFKNIAGLNEEQFRRLSGVKRKVFDRMLLILQEADQQKKVKGGRKNKLSIEDQLLMT